MLVRKAVPADIPAVTAIYEALLLFPLWGSPYDYIISGRDMASGIAYNLSRKF